MASLRPARRFADLTQPEVADMFACVQKISGVLESEYQAKSLTIAVQDGEDAGQTVHVGAFFVHYSQEYNIYPCHKPGWLSG